MSDQIFVKPAPGFHMRDEFTMQPIPAGGYFTAKTSLVIRRMMTQVGVDKAGKPVFELNACDAPAVPVEPGEIADPSAYAAALASGAIAELPSDDSTKRKARGEKAEV